MESGSAVCSVNEIAIVECNITVKILVLPTDVLWDEQSNFKTLGKFFQSTLLQFTQLFK